MSLKDQITESSSQDFTVTSQDFTLSNAGTLSSVAAGRLQVLQIYRLLQYIHERDKEQIEKMLRLGVENLINLIEPRDGKGALHLAVTANYQDMLGFLLSRGADPNIQDTRGRTPSMLAAELGNYSLLEVVTQNGADLRIEDAEGKGVLFYCMYPSTRHVRCLQVALRCRADINNVSLEGIHVFQQMCGQAQECAPMCLIMLEEGADPNAANQRTGVTALMEVAKAGSLQLVRNILRKGGDPNALDHQRSTAVHYAAMGGFLELIQVLSAFSANMGVMNCEGYTPLHYAAAAGNAKCCKFLSQRGCDAKLINRCGLLPRQIAKDSGHKAAVKELRKAEKQRVDKDPFSSVLPSSQAWALTLHDWAHENEADLRQAFGKSEKVSTESFISVLEELKAPADLKQIQTVATAHYKDGAESVNINEFIKGVKYINKPFLVSSYMPKKKKGEKGGKVGKKKGKFVLPVPICTLPPELMPRRPDGGPLHFIKKYQNYSDTRRFDPDHPPQHPIVNDSAWYMEKPEPVYVRINDCVRSADLQSLDLAFRQGIPVDVQDEFYKTPLMAACSSGNCIVAQYLLSKGADVNVSDQFFWTPLHHAAHAGQVELIEVLLEAGASIDARALNGGTPLMRAIMSSRPACVDVLIKAGASVTMENNKGQNCLDIARAVKDSRIIDLVADKIDSLSKPKGKRETAKKTRPAAAPQINGDELLFSERLLQVSAQVFLHSLCSLGLRAGGSGRCRRGALVIAPGAAGTSTATAGKMTSSSYQETKSIILHSSNITSGRDNAVDIAFVPKTVWGKPPTTSQLMSKIERRKEPLSLELDFDDFMTPFSTNMQQKTVARARTGD
ncbi:ankyrin repeat and EF-hand domain-containing protein 1 [Aulostomus maculatus]